MKRILAIALTIVMLLAALTGCTASKNPSGRENDKSGENQTTANIIRHLGITSGETTIYPHGCLLWSKIDNGDGTFTESTVDKYDVVDLVSGKTTIPVTDIPKLVMDESVSYFIQPNGRIERVSLLTPNGTEFIRSDTTFDDLSKLDNGTYYVAMEVLIAGNCDPDAPQYAYRYEDVFCLIVDGEEKIEHSEYETAIKLLQYTWDGWGISAKTVGDCDVAYNIIDALKNMRETGEIVEKISDDVIDKDDENFHRDFPVERGTMWIEADGSIYRLTPGLSQICRVETHFGKGCVLEMSDAFKTDVNNAWKYVPYDYYEGTYKSGDRTVELKRAFKADSMVELRIKNIKIEKNDNPKNKITVELISKADQTVSIKLHCQQSDDNLASGDEKTVVLKKGVVGTVELTFGGWGNSRYWVYIRADNTMAEIMIQP